ncbi:MAG: sulfotransferase domain-containing protein [Chlamydiota bacterium]
MLRKCLILFCLILQSIAYGNSPPAEYALLTIPKSGSHLLIKLLYLMCDLHPQWHVKPQSLQDLSADGKYPYTHFCLSAELLNFYSNSPQIKKIIGVRDLRDVCVSIVHQILKGTWPEFTGNKEKLEWFKGLSFDDQLMYVICQEYQNNVPHAKLQLGIAKSAAQAVVFCQDPNVLVCRFEDLVGLQGGGDDAVQKNEVARIADFLGLSLFPPEIEHLAAQLYGNAVNPFGMDDFSKYQSTFRSGKIGSWKKFFKPRHIAAFKERLGSALIALGYENDNNW